MMMKVCPVHGWNAAQIAAGAPGHHSWLRVRCDRCSWFMWTPEW